MPEELRPIGGSWGSALLEGLDLMAQAFGFRGFWERQRERGV